MEVIMSEWVPFFQSLVWPAVIVGFAFYFRSTFTSILQAIAGRIEKGSPVEAGPTGIKLGSIPKEIEKLPEAPQATTSAASSVAVEANDWRQERGKEYGRVKGYMLVHVYRP